MNNLIAFYLNRNVTFVFFFLIVIIARLALVRLPKKYSYMLWGLLGIKAVFNFGFIPKLGRISKTVQVYADKTTNIDPVVKAVTEVPTVSEMPIVTGNAVTLNISPTHSTNLLIPGLTALWALGVAVLLVIGLVGYLRIRNKVKLSFKNEDGVYICDYIESPMVFGFFNPRIYIPSGVNAGEMSYVIGHERVHLRRHDTVLKCLAFLILCFYWMNPLAWIAFKLFNLDMELSCDEAVLNKADRKVIEDYGKWLVFFASKGKVFGPVPTAFGETDVEKRVKNMKKDKMVKGIPVFAASLVVIAAVAFGCLKMPSVFAEQSVSGNDIIKDDVTDNNTDDEETVNTDISENVIPDVIDESKPETEEDENWLWPVTGYNLISRGFGESSMVMDGDEEIKMVHGEVDIPAPKGTPIVAARSGVVEDTGFAMETGNYIFIRVNDSTLTRYTHLDTVDVNNGDVVTQGSKIGEVGATGTATGPHVGFGISIDENWVDPMQFYE